MQHVTPQFPHKPPLNPLDTFLSINSTSKGTISNLYNLISKLHCSSMAAVRTAWEQDLNYTFTDDIWDSVLDQIHSSSMCSQHALLQFKVVHCTHISKTNLARMYPDVEPTWDKCKSAPVSIFHMCWTCPSLGNFWTSVFQTISETLGHQIEPDPLTAIFGIAPHLDLPKAKLSVLAFA